MGFLWGGKAVNSREIGIIFENFVGNFSEVKNSFGSLFSGYAV